MKQSKKKEAHCMDMKYGMGTYNGLGVKAKVGKLRDGYMDNPDTMKKIGKPPKSLA